MQGQGVFFDDVKRHGMGYVHFVRSPYAHARIGSIDVSAALELPGVYGTLTGDEVAILTDPFFQIAAEPGGSVRDYALAVGKVRYVGEAVVAVVAETRELARDASELVMVDYEPLEVLVDARNALDDDAPVLHEECGGNMSYTGVWEWGTSTAPSRRPTTSSRSPSSTSTGSTRRRSSSTARSSSSTAARAVDDHDEQPVPRFRGDHDGAGDAGRYRQAAHRHAGHRRRLRQQDHLAPAARRALPPRAQAQPARAVDRVADRLPPVDVARQRALVHRHRGRRQGRRDDDRVPHEALDDAGAYLRYEPLGGVIWSQVAPGMYGWRNLRVEFTQVMTNKAPCSPNRGYSRMQHLWLTERIADIVAQELGFDRVELRKRNYVQAEQMPYETPNGCVYDSGDYAKSLDLALELIGYDTIEERRRGRRAAGSSASASARRSTRGRTTSASRSS